MKKIISIILNIIIILIIISWAYSLYLDFSKLPRITSLDNYIIFNIKVLLFSLFLIVSLITLYYLDIFQNINFNYSKDVNDEKLEILIDKIDKLQILDRNLKWREIFNNEILQNEINKILNEFNEFLEINRIKQLFEKLVEISGKIVKAERVSLFVYNPEKNKLVLVAKSNFKLLNLSENEILEINDSFDLDFFINSKRFFVSNIETHPGINRENKPIYKNPSFMIFPLKFSNNKVFGVLNLSEKENGYFTKNDLDLISFLVKIFEMKVEILNNKDIVLLCKSLKIIQ